MSFFDKFSYFSRYLSWYASGRCDEMGCLDEAIYTTDIVTNSGDRFTLHHCKHHEENGAFKRTVGQLLEDTGTINA